MALVTMASTEEAIDALVVRIIFFFPLIVYNDLQLAVKLPLDVHLKSPNSFSLFSTENAQLQNHRIQPPPSVVCQDKDIFLNAAVIGCELFP